MYYMYSPFLGTGSACIDYIPNVCYYYNYDPLDRIIIPYSILAIVMLGIVLYMAYQTFNYQEKKEINER